MTKLTADDLAIEGRKRLELGRPVTFLHHSQEWMAVEVQLPFVRYEKMPTRALGQ